jgi:hypothetical protein
VVAKGTFWWKLSPFRFHEPDPWPIFFFVSKMVPSDFFSVVGGELLVEPKELHDHCLEAFANAVFLGKLSVKELLHNPNEAKVNKVCFIHPVVSTWLKRVVFKNLADVKILALNFLSYHCNYRKKPHRLLCVKTFTQIVCNLYACRIIFQGKCIYPTNPDDYLLNIYELSFNNKTKGFVMEQVEAEVPPLLNLEKNGDCFTLRQFEQEHTGDYTNTKIGPFQDLNDDVYLIRFTPSQENILYQVYPGSDDVTFYQFQTGNIMFVYAYTKDGKLEPLAQTPDVDFYLYFKIPTNTTAIIISCGTKTAQDSVQLIKKKNLC